MSDATVSFPPLVYRAHALAESLGFPLMPEGRPPGHSGPPSACIPQVGRLLQVMAASKVGGLIVEHGTGAGVGAAWLASGMSSDSKLISVELDPRLAAAARELFRDQPNVEIRQGDWHDALANEPPSDLLFMDATARKDLESRDWDGMTELVRVGGQFVMDDLTPLELWPAEWQGHHDFKRAFAFSNPRVIGVEVRTTATTAALMVTRIR